MRYWLSSLIVVMGCTASDEDGAVDTEAAETGSSTASPGESGGSSEASTADSNPDPGTTSTDSTSSPTAGADTTTSTSDLSTTGESSGGEELIGCYDYDAFSPTTVAYRADVMPILAARCSSCHSDPEESVYYGMGGTTEAEAVAIYDKLLNGIPKQAPHLRFIVPSDPVRSYMMAKVEYDDPGGTCSVIQCDEPGCELQAPPSAQLPENELAILRSWVLGGALDD